MLINWNTAEPSCIRHGGGAKLLEQVRQVSTFFKKKKIFVVKVVGVHRTLH